VAGGMAPAFRAIRRSRPDLVVTEIMRRHDLGFIRELHQRQPHLPILVFSIQDQALYAARAKEAGAHAYLMKSAGGEELIRSIRAVVRGRPGERRQWVAAKRGHRESAGAPEQVP